MFISRSQTHHTWLNALKMNVLVHRFMFMDREWRALAQFPHTTTRFLRLLGAALFLAASPLSLVRRFFDP
ncbi:hypothetical protein EMIT0324P_21184 [Pseudomonas chlororaphis]